MISLCLYIVICIYGCIYVYIFFFYYLCVYIILYSKHLRIYIRELRVRVYICGGCWREDEYSPCADIYICREQPSELMYRDRAAVGCGRTLYMGFWVVRFWWATFLRIYRKYVLIRLLLMGSFIAFTWIWGGMVNKRIM